MNKSIVELFKVVVAKKGTLDFSNLKNGFITDFTPTDEQVEVLKSLFKPLPIVTLFSVEERKNADIGYLLLKQVLHYIETYGLETPGLFDLEVSKGKIVDIAFIKAVSLKELQAKVDGLLYANRPIKDVAPVIEVIRDYKLKFKLNEVANNELRVSLYDGNESFTSGDDAVRYLCLRATKDPMLIKSKKVVAAVKTFAASEEFDVDFLSEHTLPLAQVFNRHKKLIMACKNVKSAGAVNRISRLSKTKHVPINEPLSKHYISGVLNGKVNIHDISKVSLRDKFKLLNLIEYKLLAKDYDSFVIRNGKVWTEVNRPALDPEDLKVIKMAVLRSIGKDIKSLKGKNILLDKHVKYGLPISRKQSIGQLPYGTRVVAATDKDELSAGIYWRNDWGSEKMRIDLDLSAIDENGNRTGWGQYSGYDHKNPITYSGDMTDATNGATEFMVVDPNRNNRYGLMVNVFCGPENTQTEIVVGYPSKKVWQDRTLIRERMTLPSGQSVVGFLKDDVYVVYGGRLNTSRVSHGKHPILDKGLGKLWTVADLFDELGIKYDTSVQEGVVYDHDLKYASFTFDKLEELFKI